MIHKYKNGYSLNFPQKRYFVIFSYLPRKFSEGEGNSKSLCILPCRWKHRIFDNAVFRMNNRFHKNIGLSPPREHNCLFMGKSKSKINSVTFKTYYLICILYFFKIFSVYFDRCYKFQLGVKVITKWIQRP